MSYESDRISQRVKEEMDAYVSDWCDSVAAITGKGIIHAVEGNEDKMNASDRTRYNNCKKALEERHGKNPDPRVEAIYARIYGLI